MSDAELDAVVARLAQLGRYAQLRHALEVGQLLVDTFFDGDVGAYFDRNPTKERSFNALIARRADDLAKLGLSAATLRGYVKVFDTWRQLPEAQRAGLQLSHYRQLAQVRDPDARAQLADQARSAGWSVRELGRAAQAEVAQAHVGRPTHRTRRRNAARALAQVLAAAKGVDRYRSAFAESATAWTTDQRRKIADDLDAAIAALQATRAQVDDGKR